MPPVGYAWNRSQAGWGRPLLEANCPNHPGWTDGWNHENAFGRFRQRLVREQRHTHQSNCFRRFFEQGHGTGVTLPTPVLSPSKSHADKNIIDLNLPNLTYICSSNPASPHAVYRISRVSNGLPFLRTSVSSTLNHSGAGQLHLIQMLRSQEDDLTYLTQLATTPLFYGSVV